MSRTMLAVCILASLVALSITEQRACAQYTGSSIRNMRLATQNYMYGRPTVSPYVNLATPNSSFGMSNYFTQVRPQVEQREQEMVRQRQTARMQSQLDQVQNQVRQSQQDASSMMLTGRVGWSSRGYPRFGTYMSYYPGFQRIGR